MKNTKRLLNLIWRMLRFMLIPCCPIIMFLFVLKAEHTLKDVVAVLVIGFCMLGLILQEQKDDE